MTTSQPAQKRPHLGREGEHPQGDLGQLILLAVFLAVWILDSFVFRLTVIQAPFVPLWPRLAVSGLIFLLAFELARRGHVVLSDEVRRKDLLLKTGIFARSRHPLYLGALLFYASLAVATLSIISFVSLGGIFVFYNFIAAYEETLLVEKHGEEYRQYRKVVPKWIPRLTPARLD